MPIVLVWRILTSMMPFPLFSSALRRGLRVATLSLLTAGLGSCESEPEGALDEAMGPGTNTAPRAGEFTLTLPFMAQAGAMPLACGMSFPNFGSSNSTVEFNEFSLYVHSVHLRNEEGTWVPLRMRDDGLWQRDGVALLDFLDHASPGCAQQGTAQTNTSITGFLAEGDYSGIRFTLGVPSTHNHINAVTAVAPFNRQRMWWSWASGFRYLKADLRVSTVRPDGSIKQTPKFYSHLGGTKCSKDPVTGIYGCQDPRLAVIEMPLDPTKEGIVIDAMALFAQDNLGIGRGCMGAHSLKDHSDPEELVPTSCRSQYQSVGLSTGGPVATPIGQQSLFRPVPWSGAVPSTQPMLELAVVDTPQGRRNPDYWPRSDYQRPPALDHHSSTSVANGVFSHPAGDPRHGSACLNCHQPQGPGMGQFEFGGTVFNEAGQPYAEGQVELVLSKGKGNWGAKDPSKKVPEATVHMRVPIDANGNFFAHKGSIAAFAAANGVAPLDFSKMNYQAFILNRDGERVMGMSPKKAGSCNQCHTGGFRLVVPARLMAGPWTPAPVQ